MFEMKPSNPVCGDNIKIQTTTDESLSLAIRKIEVLSTNYKLNESLEKSRKIFDELNFGKYEEDLTGLSPECV